MAQPADHSSATESVSDSEFASPVAAAASAKEAAEARRDGRVLMAVGFTALAIFCLIVFGVCVFAVRGGDTRAELWLIAWASVAPMAAMAGAVIVLPCVCCPRAVADDWGRQCGCWVSDGRAARALRCVCGVKQRAHGRCRLRRRAAWLIYGWVFIAAAAALAALVAAVEYAVVS